MSELGQPAEVEESAEAAHAGPEECSSVAEFRITPFRDEAWEIVGERVLHGDFSPMEVPVLEGFGPEFDPMFEVFGGKNLSEGAKELVHYWNPRAGLEEQSDEPEFDPAAIEAELQQKFEEGRAQGHEEGYLKGKEEIVAQYESLRGQLADLTQWVHDEISQRVAQLEQQGVELSLAIAKKILGTTADINPEYITEIIRQGVKSVGAGTPLTIRVSPRDMEFIEVVGLPPELSAQELGVNYVMDENIQSGCVIETDFGQIDLELDKMWEQVATDLREVSKG